MTAWYCVAHPNDRPPINETINADKHHEAEKEFKELLRETHGYLPTEIEEMRVQCVESPRTSE